MCTICALVLSVNEGLAQASQLEYLYVFHYVQDDEGTVQSALQCMYLVQYALSVNEGLAQPSLTRLWSPVPDANWIGP